MEAQFAFLCEGVTPEGGAADDRLTIDGFHITTVPVTGPNPVTPTMTLVIGLTYSVDEAGLKDVDLRLLAPDGPVAGTRHEEQFSGPEAGMRGRLDLIYETHPIPIENFGIYEFSLHVGDELVATVPVTVVAED